MHRFWKIASHSAPAVLWAAALWLPLAAAAAPLATAVVSGGQQNGLQSADGVVEPVRQATLAAQVAGSIVRMGVQVGDRVRAGQELLRIDAQAAGQVVQSNAAQVDAARANLALAAKELERQQQLVQQHYISPAALERSQAQYQAAQAQGPWAVSPRSSIWPRLHNRSTFKADGNWGHYDAIDSN